MSAPSQPCQTSLVTELPSSTAVWPLLSRWRFSWERLPFGAKRSLTRRGPFSTDRPSVANSSVVVPEGGFQFENGLLITSLRASTFWTCQKPPYDLDCGIRQKSAFPYPITSMIYPQVPPRLPASAISH